MANLLVRLARGIGRLPHRILGAVGWTQMEPTGLGAGPLQPEDPDAAATRRRQAREVWRKPDDEGRPPSSN